MSEAPEQRRLGADLATLHGNSLLWYPRRHSNTSKAGWTSEEALAFSTAGKVNWCLCLPRTSAQYHSCRPQRLHCTPCTLVQPSPPTAPRTTPTLTRRDCLRPIWEDLKVPIINEHHRCLKVKPAFFSKYVICYKFLGKQTSAVQGKSIFLFTAGKWEMLPVILLKLSNKMQTDR